MCTAGAEAQIDKRVAKAVGSGTSAADAQKLREKAAADAAARGTCNSLLSLRRPRAVTSPPAASHMRRLARRRCHHARHYTSAQLRRY